MTLQPINSLKMQFLLHVERTPLKTQKKWNRIWESVSENGRFFNSSIRPSHPDLKVHVSACGPSYTNPIPHPLNSLLST